jgi:hypothetical protein
VDSLLREGAPGEVKIKQKAPSLSGEHLLIFSSLCVFGVNLYPITGRNFFPYIYDSGNAKDGCVSIYRFTVTVSAAVGGKNAKINVAYETKSSQPPHRC